MQRQYVEWGNDSVEIRREMEFVRAYLGLQKYRFGERLSYSLEVEEDCLDIKIPKMTVVTFVENACVHGIEAKTAPGWIFCADLPKAEGTLSGSGRYRMRHGRLPDAGIKRAHAKRQH